MAEKPPFALEQKFTAGFQTKLRSNEVPAGACLDGSQNFIVDDDGKYRTRPGSAYLGTSDTSNTNAGTSAGRLARRDGVEIPVIAHDTQLRYYHPSLLDWAILQTGFTTGLQFSFTPNDRNSDTANRLCIANGTDSYRIWRGNTAVVSSWTINTIVVTGSTTLANLLFPAAGSISVNGIEFAYVGIAGQTFTGVTPDPTGTAIAANDPICDLPVSYGSAPKFQIGLATDNARVMGAGGNIGSGGAIGGGQIVGSKTNDPTDFTFSTPRVATDGFTLNVTEGGGKVTGLIQFEEYYAIFKNKTIKKLAFSQDGDDLIQLFPLLSYDEKTSDIGSVAWKAVFRAGNQILFISPINAIQSLQRVERIDFPVAVPLSDPIKPTVEDCLFDSTSVGIGWRGRAFIACKSSDEVSNNDIVLVYNFIYNCWESPITGIPVADFFVYGGNLYALLNTGPNVVKLWTGIRDFTTALSMGITIDHVLNLKDNDYGDRSAVKEAKQFYIEGEMDEAGSVIFTLTPEDGNARTCTLTGTESGVFEVTDTSGTFGDEEFAAETFGPSESSGEDAGRRTFRVIFTAPRILFQEIALSCRTSNYFKLLSNGPRVTLSRVQHKLARKRALTTSS